MQLDAMPALASRRQPDHRRLVDEFSREAVRIGVAGPGLQRQERGPWLRPEGEVREAVHAHLDGGAGWRREAPPPAPRAEEYQSVVPKELRIEREPRTVQRDGPGVRAEQPLRRDHR